MPNNYKFVRREIFLIFKFPKFVQRYNSPPMTAESLWFGATVVSTVTLE